MHINGSLSLQKQTYFRNSNKKKTPFWWMDIETFFHSSLVSSLFSLCPFARLDSISRLKTSTFREMLNSWIIYSFKCQIVSRQVWKLLFIYIRTPTINFELNRNQSFSCWHLLFAEFILWLSSSSVVPIFYLDWCTIFRDILARTLAGIFKKTSVFTRKLPMSLNSSSIIRSRLKQVK